MTGPRSFLSFCSQPAVNWVISRVHTPEYTGVINRIITDLARMLKVNGSLSNGRASEPLPEVAWQYTEAFFQRSPENAFGIVERPWFELRLRAHLNGTRSDDKVWYALRNVIWAIGSRIVLYKKPDFQNASHTSWGFFENALSVIADILFFRASMVGVQALILMVRAPDTCFRDTNVHFRHTTEKA